MAKITNRGKYLIFDGYFRGGTLPATFYAALVTAAAAPGPDTNLMSDLTEINAGNGYTAGGLAVPASAVGFTTLTEDDTNDQAIMGLKDLVWQAVEGELPASGAVPRYLVLTDDNATVANRQIIAYFDLGTLTAVENNGLLIVEDLKLYLQDTA